MNKQTQENIKNAAWEETTEYYRPYTLKEKIVAFMIAALAVAFIISLIGSMIWGNIGFVELLASFF